MEAVLTYFQFPILMVPFTQMPDYILGSTIWESSMVATPERPIGVSVHPSITFQFIIHSLIGASIIILKFPSFLIPS